VRLETGRYGDLFGRGEGGKGRGKMNIARQGDAILLLRGAESKKDKNDGREESPKKKKRQFVGKHAQGERLWHKFEKKRNIFLDKIP